MTKQMKIDTLKNGYGAKPHEIVTYHVQATISIGDFVIVEMPHRNYYKGTVTKITPKTVTVTNSYGTKFASTHRFRKQTFVDNLVKVENDTYKKEQVS